MCLFNADNHFGVYILGFANDIVNVRCNTMSKVNESVHCVCVQSTINKLSIRQTIVNIYTWFIVQMV